MDEREVMQAKIDRLNFTIGWFKGTLTTIATDEHESKEDKMAYAARTINEFDNGVITTVADKFFKRIAA